LTKVSKEVEEYVTKTVGGIAVKFQLLMQNRMIGQYPRRDLNPLHHLALLI